MKVRVTIMTENNKHIPVLSGEEKEKLEKRAADAWMHLLMSFASTGESITVESCDIVEF